MTGEAERIARALDPKAKRLNDDSWSCRCPAHDDQNASFSLEMKDSKLVWYCFAGCG
jgi:hypothetical protein